MTKSIQKNSNTYDQGRKGYSSKLVQCILKMIPECKFDQYVDVGCGTAALTIPIGKRFKRVLATDISLERINFCKNNHTKWPQIKFQVSSAEIIKLKKDSVDLITAAQSFMYFNREKFYKESARVLKNKGVLAIVWKYPLRPHPVLDTIDRCVEKTIKHFKTDKIHVSRNPIPYVRDEKIISELSTFGFTKFKYEEIETNYEFSRDDLYFYAIHSNGFSINEVATEINEYFKKLLFKEIAASKKVSVPFYEFVYLAKKQN